MIDQMQKKHHLIQGSGGPLKAEEDGNSARWTDPRITKHEKARQMCRDVFAGTDVVKEAGKTYLPMLPRETDDGYRIRKEEATFYNYFSATIRASTGLVFNRDPAWSSDTPDELKAWWDDVTGEGTGGGVFFRDTFETSLLGGFSVVVIDFPESTARETLADEKKANRKPYLTLYPAHHVLSFRHEKRDGALKLAQIALLEYVHEADGAFGRKAVEQVRVYRRVSGLISVQLYRKVKDATGKEVWRDMGAPRAIRGPTEIPVVEITTRPMGGFAAASPPLADVAHLTLAHYRTNAHRRWAMNATCYPLPIRVGYSAPEDGASEQAVGPTFVMDLPPGGSFGYAAPPDAAFRPTAEELDRIQMGIGVLALSYLAGESRVPETATARRISVKAQDATLLVAGKALADGMNEILWHVGAFMGVKIEPNTVLVSVDFRSSMLDDHAIQTLWTVTQGGGLSMETFLLALKTGTLPEDFDVGEELLRITAGMQERQEQSLSQKASEREIEEGLSERREAADAKDEGGGDGTGEGDE